MSKRPHRKKRPLPPANRIPSDVPPMARIEYYRVASWSPAPASDPTGKVEAVVLEIKLEGLEVPFGVRFRSPAALDELVDALLRHRADVWPEAERPTWAE